MRTLSPDTTPESEAMLIKLARQVPAWRMLAQISDMYRTGLVLALAGIRLTCPSGTPAELRRQLALRMFGFDEAPFVIAHMADGELPMQPDQMRIMFLVTDALDAIGVAYFIGGSVASMVYSVARLTRDADVIAALRVQDVPFLMKALTEDGFYADPERMRDAILNSDDSGYVSLLHQDTMVRVDLIVTHGGAFDQSQLARRKEIVVDPTSGRTAYIASAEDVILAKLYQYNLPVGRSEKHLTDVLGILKIQAGNLDMAYLFKWAVELGLVGLLSKLLEDAGLPPF